MSTIVPVVLCGGSGSRLWPASRSSYPKQFLTFADETSLFQQAVARVAGIGRPLIVTNAAYRFLVAEQLRLIGVEADILLEPFGRDSCAAIAAAAAFAVRRDPAATMVVVAADHAIPDTDVFLADVALAVEAAGQGLLVCFGLQPTSPATGYGYIRPGRPLLGGKVHEIGAFVEKPDLETAKRYVAEGLLWNSGNFAYRADVFLSELAAFQPAVLAAADAAVAKAARDFDFVLLDPDAFGQAPKISVDYAVMERTARAAVISARFAWSDVGTWSAVQGVSPADENGCAVVGDGIIADSRNCFVYSPEKLTVVGGLENVIVATTKDAVLVVSRDYSEHVKQLVSKLEKGGRSEASHHRETLRPWGAFEALDAGDGYSVKRITVKPGGRLVLQSRLRIPEYWIVVGGTAVIGTGTESQTVLAGQAVHIPEGDKRVIDNPGDMPLRLIEVQTGATGGETSAYE